MMRFLKYLLAFFFYYTGLIPLVKWFFRSMTGKNGLVVLLYHRVVEADERNGSMPEMTISPSMFAKQMNHLRTYYHPVSVRVYLKAGKKNHAASKIKVMVTFDDGWQDNYEYAYPMLEKYNVPAIIFLVSDYVGTNRLFWPERLARILIKARSPEGSSIFLEKIESILSDLLSPNQISLKEIVSNNGFELQRKTKVIIEKLKALSPDEVEHAIVRMESVMGSAIGGDGSERAVLSISEAKKMANHIIEFGSHTCNHVLLDRMDQKTMREEVVASKMALEEKTGREIKVFAYPNGNYNEEVIKEVKRAGYEAAFTTEFGVNTGRTSPFELKRIRVDDSFSKGPTGKFSKSLFELQIVRNILKSFIRG